METMKAKDLRRLAEAFGGKIGGKLTELEKYQVGPKNQLYVGSTPHPGFQWQMKV